MAIQNSNTDKLATFDHVVVLMLENRSFDNLLGFLYTPEELKELKSKGKLPLGQTFEGLNFGGKHCNPIPGAAANGSTPTELCVTRASDFHQPFPDPGEPYQHVNTQLYGKFIPESNSGKPDNKIVAPFNLPTPVPAVPPMDGFIKDYISVLQSMEPVKKGCGYYLSKLFGFTPKGFNLNDRIDDFKVIMECFQPDQVNVMATLAKQFAVFDNWHCAVPSQTYTNRAFWHAATAKGHVNNSPMSHWILEDIGPTLFNRLEEKKISWNIYTDNPVSITGIVHFQPLLDFHLTRFKSFKQFLEDARNDSLPAYSFVEPRFFTPHNDQHPSGFDSVIFGPSVVGSVLSGEKLINDVYNAIRTSENWKNTLMIITHDEHGGCYDHVPPGAATPPDPGAPVGQDGFRFDRLGFRVPMIMVSAHIKPHTIVNNPYQHTSFLKTMERKWALKNFTGRDESATEFTEVFTSDSARDVSEWPVIPDPVFPAGHDKIAYSKAPLNDLQKVLLKW